MKKWLYTTGGCWSLKARTTVLSKLQLLNCEFYWDNLHTTDRWSYGQSVASFEWQCNNNEGERILHYTLYSWCSEWCFIFNDE